MKVPAMSKTISKKTRKSWVLSASPQRHLKDMEHGQKQVYCSFAKRPLLLMGARSQSSWLLPETLDMPPTGPKSPEMSSQTFSWRSASSKRGGQIQIKLTIAG